MKETRKLAAVMFTDIVGYTAIMSKDEQKALTVLQKNIDIQKPLVKKFNGEFLKEMGDGTLLCFQSALDAVQCAIELQREVQGDPDLKLRIGIHLGDIVFKEGDIYGDGVNVASRIEQKEQGEVTVVPAKKRKSVFIIALWIIAGGIGFAAFMFAIFHFMEKGKKKQPFEQMEITRITTHGKAKDAVISPDGRYIVHVMEKDGLESLWLRQVATSSNVQILPPDKIRFQGLTFSGDGNYIFYISLDNSQSIPILYRMPVLGGSSVKILENVSGSIAFSPDNTRFAFIRLILSQGRQNFLLPT